MDFERLNGDIKEMRRRNRGLALTVGLLAAAHVLALVVILNLLGTVRTVIAVSYTHLCSRTQRMSAMA